MSTAPDEIRTRFARHTTLGLVTAAAAMRPRPGEIVDYAIRVARRELARRGLYLAGEIERVDGPLTPLIAQHSPAMLVRASPRIRSGTLRERPVSTAMRCSNAALAVLGIGALQDAKVDGVRLLGMPSTRPRAIAYDIIRPAVELGIGRRGWSAERPCRIGSSPMPANERRRQT